MGKVEKISEDTSINSDLCMYMCIQDEKTKNRKRELLLSGGGQPPAAQKAPKEFTAGLQGSKGITVDIAG